MGITRKVWINYRDTPKIELKDPIAIVGSSGLRSVGKIVVDVLVKKLQPQLFAELYSYGFPCIYYGPSYLEAPSHAGALIAKGNVVELPNVAVYVLKNENTEQVHGQDIVIVSGYQAYDALNHYMVADKLADLLIELNVKQVISLGAQVIEEGIRCCATDVDLLEEMSHYGIEKTHVDRFIGFSGLVAAIGREKGIKGVCLFSSTTQNLSDPEYPDFSAAKDLVEKVGEILGLRVDTSDLERQKRRDTELIKARIERESEESMAETRKWQSEELSGYI
jgi:proteasome assembly chaperone (PAC2) family protein